MKPKTRVALSALIGAATGPSELSFDSLAFSLLVAVVALVVITATEELSE